MNEKIYDSCISALNAELLPAMGCTEPVSVAYAAALAKETLGVLPTRVELCVSGNILKNVKSVVVPNTGGLRGIAAAAAAGIIAGESNRELEILSTLTDEDRRQISIYLERAKFSVSEARMGCIFDIGVRAFHAEQSAYVRITGHHTNVVHVEKSGEVLLSKDSTEGADESKTPLSVRDILTFANEVKIDDVRPLIKRQIDYNRAISEEGLRGSYGAQVGKTLLKAFGNEVHNRAKAAAAAGSDARMNGCSLPVVIVSGSGNQGITASIPVVTYAEHLGVSEEKLYRALVLSDLLTIHLKTDIGRLSAYCGAVSAGCGAAAGICYLYGGGYEEISRTLVNALAIDSGIVCDGAKSSCAAKIASSVEAGLLAFELCRGGNGFHGGDGIVEQDVENTIHNVGDLASKGMRGTDEEIIRLMLKTV